jgi:hypothetical protein
MMYAETSAITGEGVDAAFMSAFEELVKRAVDEKILQVSQPLPVLDANHKKSRSSMRNSSSSARVSISNKKQPSKKCC